MLELVIELRIVWTLLEVSISPNVHLWPRLCRNVFERVGRSKPDRKSSVYAKSTSADVPKNFRFNIDADTSILTKRFCTLFGRKRSFASGIYRPKANDP